MNRKRGADTHVKLQVYIPVCSFAPAGNGLNRPHWDCIFTSALGRFISMGFFFGKNISVGNQMSKNSLLIMFLWALVK